MEDEIQQFVKNNNPKLYILTPCYGNMCTINYLNQIILTVEIFRKFNFPLQLEFCRNDSLVSRARNNLIARAMADPKTTHMMFIDNDITWNPYDILKLIIYDKHLIGGIYPLKNYEWNRVTPTNIQQFLDKKNNSQFKNLMDDESMIQYNLLRYNINNISESMKIENNLAKVRHLATGFMLIKRDTISKMMIAFPSTKYTCDIQFLRPEENEYAYALFDCGVEEGHYLSEDWMFCDRWIKMGGSIYVDVTINLTHTGQCDFRGSFLSTIL